MGVPLCKPHSWRFDKILLNQGFPGSNPLLFPSNSKNFALIFSASLPTAALCCYSLCGSECTPSNSKRSWIMWTPTLTIVSTNWNLH